MILEQHFSFKSPQPSQTYQEPQFNKENLVVTQNKMFSSMFGRCLGGLENVFDGFGDMLGKFLEGLGNIFVQVGGHVEGGFI